MASNSLVRMLCRQRPSPFPSLTTTTTASSTTVLLQLNRNYLHNSSSSTTTPLRQYHKEFSTAATETHNDDGPAVVGTNTTGVGAPEAAPSFNGKSGDRSGPFDHQGHREQKLFGKGKNKNKKKKNVRRERPSVVPTSDWMLLSGVARQATLEDLLTGLEVALHAEKERGILDLDSLADAVARRQDKDEDDGPVTVTPRYWDHAAHPELPAHGVLEARSHLNVLRAHTGWYVRLPNRSVVHALSEHYPPIRVGCGLPVTITAVSPDDDARHRRRVGAAEALGLDDRVLRVEHVPPGMTEERLLGLLRSDRVPALELDHLGPRPAVELLVARQDPREVGGPRPGALVRPPARWTVPSDTWLVRCATASDARSALRYLQSYRFPSSSRREPALSLSQYPRQLLPSS